MCFGRRKQIKKTLQKMNSLNRVEGKYKLGEFVHFRYRDELYFGYVNWVYKKEDQLLYDIQVGGQCPAIIKGIKEEALFIVEKK